MRMTKSLLFVFFILFVGAYFFWFHTESACHIKEGHWATNGSYCITRNCYQTNSCGSWASPAARCSNLEIGDSISEVYFQLGQPKTIEAETYTWRAGKSGGVLVATIIDVRLASLQCEAT